MAITYPLCKRRVLSRLMRWQYLAVTLYRYKLPTDAKRDLEQNGEKMPTQENLEGYRSDSETRKEKKSTTLESEALAVEKPSLSDMPEPTQSEMTKAEALAILWTGIEALAMLKQANLYHSPKTGRVVIELLAVSYDPANGLQSVVSA